MLEDGIPTAEEAWNRLTEADKKKAKELEALLTLHRVIENKDRQEDLLDKLDEAISSLEEQN